MSEYKQGDRLKVTVEGEVINERSGYLYLKTGGGVIVGFSVNELDSSGIVTQRMVEVFKPGDRIIEKESGFEYTLAVGGYIAHSSGNWCPDYDTEFTSDHYQLVHRSSPKEEGA